MPRKNADEIFFSSFFLFCFSLLSHTWKGDVLNERWLVVAKGRRGWGMRGGQNMLLNPGNTLIPVWLYFLPFLFAILLNIIFMAPPDVNSVFFSFWIFHYFFELIYLYIYIFSSFEVLRFHLSKIFFIEDTKILLFQFLKELYAYPNPFFFWKRFNINK